MPAKLTAKLNHTIVAARDRNARRLPYWADPHRSKKDQINHWDDGRGVYFEDPNGHLLEILTQSYGSAGTAAVNPHPLVAEKLEREPANEQGSASSSNTNPCESF